MNVRDLRWCLLSFPVDVLIRNEVVNQLSPELVLMMKSVGRFRSLSFTVILGRWCLYWFKNKQGKHDNSGAMLNEILFD